MSYTDILDFYYTGTTLSRLDDTDVAPATRYPSGVSVGKAPAETAAEENTEPLVEVTEASETPQPQAEQRRIGW